MARNKAPIDEIAEKIGKTTSAITPKLPETSPIAWAILEARASSPQEFVAKVAAPAIGDGARIVESTLIEAIGEAQESFDASGRHAGENVTIFIPNRSSLRKVRGLVHNWGEVRLIANKQYGARSGILARTHIKLDQLLHLGNVTADLSKRQLEALSIAVEKGYYDSPRKAGMDSLAKAMGVDEATYSEHLRKVENKLMPAFLRVGMQTGTPAHE